MPEASPTSMTRRRPGPVWALVLLGLYFLVMTLQAALLAPSGRSDDIETLLLSQSLEWGYESKNPPAFYWLAWGATTLLGPSLPVIYGLRLAGIFAGFLGLCAVARRVQPDPLLAVCAGLAMLATLHFHWYPLNYLTNTSFALALGPLAVLALLRLRDHRGWGAYAVLGALLGLGMLTRYNFAIFAAGLVMAALSTPVWRARLLRPQALAAGLVAMLMLAPHVLWVAGHWEVLSGQVQSQIVGVEAPPYPSRVLEGLANLAKSAVSILLAPLGILAAVCFPRTFRPIAIADSERAADLALIGRTVLACLGLMLLYVVAGSSYVKPHHLFFLAFAPLWLISRLDPADLSALGGAGLRARSRRLRDARRDRLPLRHHRRRAALRGLRAVPAHRHLRRSAARGRVRARDHSRAVAPAGLPGRRPAPPLPRRTDHRRRLPGLRPAAESGAGRLRPGLERPRRVAGHLGRRAPRTDSPARPAARRPTLPPAPSPA